jgi:HPt (histidine-containing phosphotransfer) domain-containing protein
MDEVLPKTLLCYIDLDLALSYVNGRRDTLRNLLINYVEWEKDTAAKLLLAQQQNRRQDLLKELHRLKTSVRQIGAASLANAIEILEEELKAEGSNTSIIIPQKVADFCARYQTILDGLRLCFAPMK